MQLINFNLLYEDCCDWWHFPYPTIWHSFPTRNPWARLLFQKVIVFHPGNKLIVLYSFWGVTYSVADRYQGSGGMCFLHLLGWRLFGLLLGIIFWLKFTKYLAIVGSERCIMWHVHKLYVIRLYQRVHIHIRNKHEATVLKYSGTKRKRFHNNSFSHYGIFRNAWNAGIQHA